MSLLQIYLHWSIDVDNFSGDSDRPSLCSIPAPRHPLLFISPTSSLHNCVVTQK